MTSEELHAAVIQRYQLGRSLRMIARELETQPWVVKKILLAHRIRLRTPTQATRLRRARGLLIKREGNGIAPHLPRRIVRRT